MKTKNKNLNFSKIDYEQWKYTGIKKFIPFEINKNTAQSKINFNDKYDIIICNNN